MDEGRDLGEEQSASSTDYSAVPAAEMRWKTFFMKVGENAKRFAVSKASLMRDSDALLTLVGEIFHGDSEYWGILLTKHHGKGHVQSRCARHIRSTTNRSQSSLWIHQLKLFQTGWNVALCPSAASDGAAAGFLPVPRTRPSSPNTVQNSVMDRVACPTIPQQSF